MLNITSDSPTFRLFLIFITGMLLVSLTGLSIAMLSPDETEEIETLVTYQHEGEFGYTAYLTPSYLFGPEPEPQEETEEPEEVNPKYFTKIVNSIEMTFEFDQTSLATYQVGVTAILENPDFWQKEVNLVLPTAKTSDSLVSFTLDIDALNGIFDTINEEIDINSSERVVTIVADIIAGSEVVFSQSLPIVLGSNFVEVDSILILTEGEYTGEFDYVISLKENSLYDTVILRPPSYGAPAAPVTPPATRPVGPGEPLFTNLIDSMELTFSYGFQSDQPLTNLSESVQIVAILENPDVWSKTLVLVPRSNKSGVFSVSFPLDLEGITELFNNIRAETGVTGESYNLRIEATVNLGANTQHGQISEVFRHTLNIPLDEGVIDWGEELEKTEAGSISETHTVSGEFLFGLAGMSVLDASVLFAILSVIFLPLFLLLLVVFLRSRLEKLSLLEKKARQLRKKYGDMIVDIKALPAVPDSQTQISLNSLDDVINTAQELGKVILHYAGDSKHSYYVMDGPVSYQYAES